jgi:hypothetical protein
LASGKKASGRVACRLLAAGVVQERWKNCQNAGGESNGSSGRDGSP